MKGDKKKPKKKSSAAGIIASVLLVGGATAFSALVAFDIITFDIGPAAKTGPVQRPGPGPGPNPTPGPNTTPGPLSQNEDEKDAPADPPPDAAETQRLATEREQWMRARQSSEKPIV